MDTNDIKPVALIAGLAVIGGLLLFKRHERISCEELPDIYDENSPLGITEDYHDQAYHAARARIRAIIQSDGEAESITDTKLYVANQLKDCDWSKLTTHEQKRVWNAISTIVEDVTAQAQADNDAFLQSF